MHNIAVIRSVDSGLVWYPPGSTDGPQPLDTEAARDALRAAITQSQVTPLFAVPGEDARLLHMRISAEEKKHLGKSLPFMLEEQLAEDITDLHFARHAINKLERGVAVCSVERMQVFESLLEEFSGVKLWLPEVLLLPWHAGDWCLVLEETVAIVRTGQCAGFSIERTMLPALLESCLGGNSPGRPEPPAAVVIYGRDQAADTGLIPEALRNSVQWRKGDLYTAMLVAESPNPPLNLRQGEFAQRLPIQRWWLQWRTVAAVFAAGLALHLLATYMDYRHLQQENVALRMAVETSYRRVFPRGAVPRPEVQLQRELDGLTGSGQSTGVVSFMARVGAVIAASNGTSIVSINYNDKTAEMRINIVTANYETVEQVRAGINAAGLEAVMENSSAQQETVRARLRIGEKS